MRTLWMLVKHPSFTKFIVTGLLNTVVGLGTIYLLMWLCAMPEGSANALGYAVGLVFSYQVNSRWTFRYRQSLAAALPRYLIVIVLAYLANYVCLHVCLKWWQLNPYLAQAITVVPYAGIGYLGMRFWVFVPTRHSDAQSG